MRKPTDVTLWLSTATSYLNIGISVMFTASYATWEALIGGILGLQAQLVLIWRALGRLEGKLERKKT